MKNYIDYSQEVAKAYHIKNKLKIETGMILMLESDISMNESAGMRIIAINSMDFSYIF